MQFEDFWGRVPPNESHLHDSSSLAFEWDPDKAASNFKKHGISFDTARTVFADLNELTIHDPVHSYDEERYLSLGMTKTDQLLIVSYTERGDVIRIISARRANRKERANYERAKSP